MVALASTASMFCTFTIHGSVISRSAVTTLFLDEFWCAGGVLFSQLIEGVSSYLWDFVKLR